MKEQGDWLQQYLRNLQAVVPPGRNITEKMARRQRMVRLLRRWLQGERNRDGIATA